jgi:triacylglycerol esterase/lipase EstA (alpha/beta hydrolase family)
MPLTPTKQLELQRALADAGDEVMAQAPAHGLAPLLVPAGADLNIVQHRDSGCIQFEFPPPGQTLLPEARRGAEWILRAALRAGERMTQAAIEAVEAHSKPEGLVSLRHGLAASASMRASTGLGGSAGPAASPGLSASAGLGALTVLGTPASPAALAAARGRKVLLLVHGVFSSTASAFADLGGEADMADATSLGAAATSAAAAAAAAGGGTRASAMSQLLQRYDGLVFGYDHWTIAKTPQQNALDLLAHIPADAGWEVDIVCHSRGGLLVRALLADASDDAMLAAIARQRRGRIAKLGKVVFVAAANQGSPLAEPEQLRNFLNIAAMLASFSGGMALDVVIGLARMVVSLGFERPSVQALASGSALVAALNRSGSLLDGAHTAYARANFDFGESVLERTGALINRVLMAATDNDVVVPYATALLPDAHASDNTVLNFGTPQHKQQQVWHTEFFKQAAMQRFLLRHLA